MMMNSKVEEFIIQASADDLVNWIRTNPNLINRHIDSLENRIKQLTFDSSGNDISKFFSVLLFNFNNIGESEYRLLKQLSLSQLKSESCKLDVKSFPYLSIVYLFESDPNKMCELCVKQICRDIVNLYIPCDNSECMIDLFLKEFKLSDILVNKNSDWFCNKYNKTESLLNKYMLKEMLLLFKYLIDILTNEESKFDHVVKLHGYYNRTYVYRNKFNEISDRYEKYFKDDTRLIITNIIDLYLSNETTNSIHDFLIKWSSIYSTRVNKKILNCLISEVKLLVNMIKSNDNISSLDDIINKWGLQIYNVEPDFDSLDLISDDDRPISYLESIATEAVHRDSKVINEGERKIYHAYKNYKEAEEKVDSQITKAVNGMKGVLIGDVRSEVIEGKKFSAISLLKRLLGTVAIFSTSKIAGVITLVTKYALKKKTTEAERRSIIMDLETELELIDEKINDAKGDNNREAKYAMMRTRKDLQNALTRIQYGMEADSRTMSRAKQVLDTSRGGV